MLSPFRRLSSSLHRNRHLTPTRLLNLALMRVEMKLGRTRLWSRPYQLCIDVSNKCNLGCPFCPTGRRENGRPRGNISFDVFASIVDELAPYAMSLELFNWGEPFFNPELARLIEHAYRRRYVTMVSSNLSFTLKEDVVRAIVRSGLTALTASVDGADQRSYEIYRRGGNFDRVLQNLRTFVRVKRELGSSSPHLCWQYLIFGHNEDRVEEARQLSAELGLDSFNAVGGLYEDESWAPRGDYSFPYLQLRPNRCAWLWNKAVFHWDGGMASCCMGFYKGDDFAQWQPGTFREMWNNEKFVAARRIWTEPESPLPAGHYCTNCKKVQIYRGLESESASETTASCAREVVG